MKPGACFWMFHEPAPGGALCPARDPAGPPVMKRMACRYTSGVQGPDIPICRLGPSGSDGPFTGHHPGLDTVQALPGNAFAAFTQVQPGISITPLQTIPPAF